MNSIPIRRLVAGALSIPLLVSSSLARIERAEADAFAQTCEQGQVLGAWNLPIEEPGEMGGVLIDEFGNPVLEFHAALFPEPHPHVPLLQGHVQGLLTTLPTPHEPPQPVAYVIGDWVVLPNGVGVYDLYFVVPSAHPWLPPQVVGQSQGQFLDDPDPTVVGQFGGAWVLCP